MAFPAKWPAGKATFICTGPSQVTRAEDPADNAPAPMGPAYRDSQPSIPRSQPAILRNETNSSFWCARFGSPGP